MFTWNRKWSLRPIEVCEEKIEFSNEVKLLGITLDSKLTFNTHIDNITKKCIGTLFQNKRAIGPTWGFSPKVCHWIYTEIIRPTLAYCSIVGSEMWRTKSTLNDWKESKEWLSSIWLAPCPRHRTQLLTISQEHPTSLKGEAAKGSVRLMGQGHWTLETAPSGKGIIKAHSILSNNFLHTLNINKHDSWDITKPKLVLDHSYTITYPTASLTEDYKNRLNSDIIEASTHGICCFTDGSKTEHGTSGGFVISDTRTKTITEHSFKTKDYCTVFQAETAAIKHAVEELITFNNQQITFWSDSLSTLQALSDKIHNNKSINDCHKALTKLADENTVHLKWIKAHTGHWGNEKADELAKAGTVSSNLVCSLVPLNHIKNMINDKGNSLTHKRWNTNRHAHADLILGNHHTKTLKILTNNLNNRTRYHTGICIITGHIGLNKHLHRINRSDTSNCPNCTDTEETVAHYIGQCPAYSRIRGDTLGTYYDSINNIMDNNNIDLRIYIALKTKRLLKKEEKDDTGVT